jgi:hypothetical protein
MRLRYLLMSLLVAALLPVTAWAQETKGKIYLSSEEIAEIQRGTACRKLVKQFFALQKRMGVSGIQTENYDLKIMPERELIENQPGKYYIVYLKDATKRARFGFPGGQYVIQDFETRFRQSLTAFVRDILSVIEGGAPYEIYTRGSSSATPMSQKRLLVKGREYTSIEYLRKVDKERFTAEDPGVHNCEKAYSNKDLPFLRAEFLKRVVHDFYPLKQPKVLQSEIGAIRRCW